MKKVTTIIKSALFISLFLGCFNNKCYSQFLKKETFRAYKQIDTTRYTSSTLFLFTDDTFVHYGTNNDGDGAKPYVWYTCGKWHIKNGEVVCTTTSGSFEQSQLLNDIKLLVTQNPDSSLYTNSKTYVNEKYSNHAFVVIKNKLYDVEKKIDYLNLQSKASPMFIN